jgi:hypothetical protein
MKQESIPQFLTEVLSSNRMIQWEIDSHRVKAHDSKGDLYFALNPVDNTVEVKGSSLVVKDENLYSLVYWQAAKAIDPVDFQSLSRDLLRAYSHNGKYGHYISTQAMDQASLHIVLEKCL